MRLYLAAVLLICALPILGQSDRGSITGAIADPTGAVISGAKVEAKNAGTSATYEVGSSTTGNYVLPELPTGTYELTVTVAGFKKYVQQNIFIPVATTVRVDVTMQVGSNAESVTVTEAAPLLKTESGELSHNVTIDQANNLPVLTIGGGQGGLRNPYMITNLLPGSSYTVDSQIRINGIPNNTQSLRIEGQDATTGIYTSLQSWTQPSVDAVQEVSIQTSNYAAEFGQAGGGVYNTTMKSGTNQYHGSAYDYMANEAFNAGTPNTQKPGSPNEHIRNRQRRNDYGFTLGGPVRIPKLFNGRDKTFFFFNFEQYRETIVTYGGTAAGIKTVPTPAIRNGDFSAVLGTTSIGTDQLGNKMYNNQIFDPCSTTVVNGIRTRTPFPNNTIPLGANSCFGGPYLDPVTAKIQALMPMPTNNNLFQNYYVTFTDPKRQTVPSFKIDQNLGSKMKLSGYWGRTSLQNPNNDGMPFPITSSRGTDIVTYTYRMNFDYTLRPTMLLHFGAGLLDTGYLEKVPPLGTQYDVLGYFGLAGTGTTQVFPTISAASLSNGAYGGYAQQIGPFTQIQIRNLKPTGNVSLTWVKSNHTFKFGGELVVDGYINHSNTYAAPWINFSPVETSTPAAQGQIFTGGTQPGFGYASFLLGMADNGYTSVPNETRLGRNGEAAFAQDTWKVTRKLTLDYGLRYDFQTYLKEQYGRQGEIGYYTANPIAGGRNGGTIFEATCRCAFAHNYPYAWGPRLGVAYQVTPKTVVRVGGGLSYTKTPANNYQSYAVASNTPYATPQYGTQAYLLRNGLPYKITFPNFDPGQLPYNGVPSNILNDFDRNAGRPARVAQWSVFIQRELRRDLMVELGYVGNRGAWFQTTSAKNDNTLTAATLAHYGLSLSNPADRQLLNSPVNSPLAVSRGFGVAPYPLFPTTLNVVQSLLPYPEYTTLLYLWSPLGSTKYDAMQSSVTKRFSHGLEFNANFTWAKQMENGVEGDPLASGSINDVFNHNQNWYLSANNQPFLFVWSGTYTVPKPASTSFLQNKVVSHIVRDWQVGAVIRESSGLPVTSPASINQLSTVLGPGRSTFYNAVAGQPFYTQDINCHSCYDPSQTLVLNPNAWVDPGAGNWGTAAARYANYSGARHPSESLSIGRNFRFHEGRMNFQIRADFTNALNHWYWPNPTGTPATPVLRNSAGQITQGYGFINLTGGLGATPRSGLLVGRFSF
ncbi:MAG: TonB-dependent receptor [Bryobacterales bacterium]|nr:TonB-dependent receptor [Bryobacterales bacterium]MBV9399477.1 TonB-dependent receptor [Bryobacterales bacterium]